MGFWRDFLGFPSPTSGIRSPYSAPSDSIVSLVVPEILGEVGASLPMTRELALRVPGVKRAHGIHCSIFAGLPFFLNVAEQRDTEQPAWLTTSASGFAPYHRQYAIASDLFFYGWACQGFNADKSDAIHIPYGLWGYDDGGQLVLHESVRAEFRSNPVAIPMGYGSNGLLVDGLDTLKASRTLERVWMDRIENPLPQTDLHLTSAEYDGMSKKEQYKLIDQYNEGRKRSGGQTAVSKSFMEIRALGTTPADLFEKGRNAIRLDLANHCAVPASIIEGAKDGGGTDINYSNDASNRNELYDFGTKSFVQAYEARMSLDDVCEPGKSIRADLSNFMAVPTPANNPTSTD